MRLPWGWGRLAKFVRLRTWANVLAVGFLLWRKLAPFSIASMLIVVRLGILPSTAIDPKEDCRFDPNKAATSHELDFVSGQESNRFGVLVEGVAA